MTQEAMKLALEAVAVLEKLFKQAEAMHKGVFTGCNVDCQITLADLRKGLYAAPALREALADQPAQQEPFTYYRHYDNGLQDWPDEKTIPLYTSPPAQRTWVGLTRAECLQIEKDTRKYYDYQHECKTVCLPEFARAIEAKLKEKNNG